MYFITTSQGPSGSEGTPYTVISLILGRTLGLSFNIQLILLITVKGRLKDPKIQFFTLLLLFFLFYTHSPSTHTSHHKH